MFKLLLLLQFVITLVYSNCVDMYYPSFNESILSDFTIEAGDVSVINNELVLSMNYNSDVNFGDAVTLAHNKFFNFGKISGKIRVENVPGAVGSFILMSKKTGLTEIKDEIDWEWVSNRTEVQTNYFLTDKPVFSTNGRRHFVNDYTTTHDYLILWKKGEISWYINNELVRKVKKSDLPKLESQVRMGIWDSGRSESPGTIKWAGGPIDWNIRKSVKMVLTSMKIECHTNKFHNTTIDKPIKRKTCIKKLK